MSEEEIEDALSLIGKEFKHGNGGVYIVLLISNLYSDREKYVPTVVYQGENGKIWSRPLSDLYRSFIQIENYKK